ncbi:hypothetical protein BOTBODRAFT_172405 [Botryobasidium botryosum FD-172 SS1]|uniref:Uncharacterized protein n=1 Tax=Botryobasidium botryosum (strain FD-172 SS1) TaxID=930990 RepID=A0A067MNQ4_BOTB1|nr:hypothetical protein BOTBODRAFT_172405 [Botryobasidium botryosum FD-172 SS1]
MPLWLVIWFVTDIHSSKAECGCAATKETVPAAETGNSVKVEKVQPTHSALTSCFVSLGPSVATSPHPLSFCKAKPCLRGEIVQMPAPTLMLVLTPTSASTSTSTPLYILPSLDLFDDDMLEATSPVDQPLASLFDIKFIDDDKVMYPIRKSSASIREARWNKAQSAFGPRLIQFPHFPTLCCWVDEIVGEMDAGIAYDGVSADPDFDTHVNFLATNSWGESDELKAVQALGNLCTSWQRDHHPLALLSGPRGTHYLAQYLLTQLALYHKHHPKSPQGYTWNELGMQSSWIPSTTSAATPCIHHLHSHLPSIQRQQIKLLLTIVAAMICTVLVLQFHTCKCSTLKLNTNLSVLLLGFIDAHPSVVLPTSLWSPEGHTVASGTPDAPTPNKVNGMDHNDNKENVVIIANPQSAEEYEASKGEVVDGVDGTDVNYHSDSDVDGANVDGPNEEFDEGSVTNCEDCAPLPTLSDIPNSLVPKTLLPAPASPKAKRKRGEAVPDDQCTVASFRDKVARTLYAVDVKHVKAVNKAKIVQKAVENRAAKPVISIAQHLDGA